jgi:hypothetical protein
LTISAYEIAIGTFLPMLHNLSEILTKGQQQIVDRGGDPATLAGSRLAPDMFPLVKQVQLACDKAKNAAARLAGQEPPDFEDTEQDIAELQVRISRTIAYIEGIPASAYVGAEQRIVELPLPGQKLLSVNGLQLIRDWMLPNFYFHVVIAYGILRQSGADLGKRDFLGHAVAYIRQN